MPRIPRPASLPRLAALPLACAVLALGCNVVEAKREAEALADANFAARAAGETETALAMYDELVGTRAQWAGVLGQVQARLGRPGERSLVRIHMEWGDQGAGPGRYTTLDYEVQYTRHPAEERIVVYAPSESGPTRIVGHHLTSPGLE